MGNQAVKHISASQLSKSCCNATSESLIVTAIAHDVNVSILCSKHRTKGQIRALRSNAGLRPNPSAVRNKLREIMALTLKFVDTYEHQIFPYNIFYSNIMDDEDDLPW